MAFKWSNVLPKKPYRLLTSTFIELCFKCSLFVFVFVFLLWQLSFNFSCNSAKLSISFKVTMICFECFLNNQTKMWSISAKSTPIFRKLSYKLCQCETDSCFWSFNQRQLKHPPTQTTCAHDSLLTFWLFSIEAPPTGWMTRSRVPGCWRAPESEWRPESSSVGLFQRFGSVQLLASPAFLQTCGAGWWAEFILQPCCYWSAAVSVSELRFKGSRIRSSGEWSSWPAEDHHHHLDLCPDVWPHEDIMWIVTQEDV